MATVVSIIKLALKDIGALGVGETPTADELTDSFDTLKQLVAQWQIDGLMIYASAEVSFAATGAQSYTIGAGGDVNTTRPTEIVGAFWRDGSIDYPLDVLAAFDEYQRIGSKSDSGTPEVVFYDPDNTLGTLYVWPKPSSGTLHLTVRSPLPSYASTTENLSVPGEYELALRYSLAELLSAAFQLPLRPDIAALAKRARKLVKRNNVRIPELQMPSAIPHAGRYDINRGQ